MFNSILMEREKGLKVFKIKKFKYFLCRLPLIFGLPSSKSKDCVYMWVYEFRTKKKKIPNESIELKITENSLCTAACFYTDS